MAAAETGTAPVLAGISLAGVLVASALVALSGLSWNARVAGRDAAFAGDREEATRQAEKATGLAPWDVEAALLLARLTADVALDGPDETGLALALERADQVVRLSPVRPAARELRANLRLRSGDRQGALADLTEAARLYPLDTSYERSRELLRRRMETDLAGPSPRP